jgi:Leucine-rich repeat (LRR) protein
MNQDDFFETYNLTELEKGVSIENYTKKYKLNKNKEIVALNLSGINLNNFSSFDILINVEKLIVNNCKLENIDNFINKCKKLTYLDACVNQINEVSIENKNLKLEGLFLRKNNLKNLNFLNFLENLTKLDACENQINEINLENNNLKLKRLCLNSNKIPNLTFLNYISTLQELRITNNPLTSDLFSNLKCNNIIKSIDISCNKFLNLCFLSEFKNIEYLGLDSCDINDILLKSFPDLHKLKRLDINNNKITKLTFLKNCKEIKRLDIGSNNICSINEIRPYVNSLIFLSIYENKQIEKELERKLIYGENSHLDYIKEKISQDNFNNK